MADEAVKRPGSRSHCRIVRHFALGAGRPTDSLAPCVGASTGDDLGLSLMLQIAAEPGNISQRPESRKDEARRLDVVLASRLSAAQSRGLSVVVMRAFAGGCFGTERGNTVERLGDENRTAQCACQRRGCGDAGLATAQPASQPRAGILDCPGKVLAGRLWLQ